MRMGDVTGVRRALRGKPPRRLRAAPLPRGEWGRTRRYRGTTPAASGGTPFYGRGLFWLGRGLRGAFHPCPLP
ncbi:MAG: hypothetical protein LBM98_00870 [Oscillospiraceae bacterium]|nr:hypothetical protein [Oscillospiraceae bacterium]